jgi:hypothetical protein
MRLAGGLLSDPQTVGGMPAGDWVAQVVAELQALPNVRIMRGPR